MTKKDYVVIAESVKAAREELEGDQAHDGPTLASGQWDYIFDRVVSNLARKLAEQNPAFNAGIFKKACKGVA